jgi:hypothetical protein
VWQRQQNPKLCDGEDFSSVIFTAGISILFLEISTFVCEDMKTSSLSLRTLEILSVNWSCFLFKLETIGRLNAA